jgi:anti-sigma factor RsiW
MNTPSSSTLLHGETFRLLPWYVKGQLDSERLQQVGLHLQGCLSCRREAEGLTQLFCAHAQLRKPRPVDEARLGALFARIERYETSQRRQPPRAGHALSSLRQLRDIIAGWFDNRLMLIGSACAAVMLAILVGPLLLSPQGDTRQHVLSSPVTAPNEVRVKLQFRSDMSPADAERVIAKVLVERNLQIAHRIERRSAREYALVLEQKPDFGALSGLLGAWAAAPEVATATIDDGVPER